MIHREVYTWSIVCVTRILRKDLPSGPGLHFLPCGRSDATLHLLKLCVFESHLYYVKTTRLPACQISITAPKFGVRFQVGRNDTALQS